MRNALLTAALVFSCIDGATSQVVPFLLTAPASTRALGLGNSYTVSSTDSDAIFYNPVLLLTGRGLAMSVERWSDDRTVASFSTTMDVNFGFGLQIAELNISAIDAPIGTTAGEAVATAGYARIIKGVRIGAAAKYLHHWQNGEANGNVAFDLGSTVNPLNWLTVALAVRNIGSDFEAASVHYEMPHSAVLAAATRSKVIGPLDAMLAGRIEHNLEDEFAGGMGLEVSYWPFSGLTFSGRAGIRIDPPHRASRDICLPSTGGCGSLQFAEPEDFTAGGTVTFRRVTLDYAWDPYKAIADGHRIGLRIR